MSDSPSASDPVQVRSALRRVSTGEGTGGPSSVSFAPAPVHNPYVLVVDDDLGTRETFDWALRASGIRVRTSASGRDAIRLSKTDCFDLLLVDLELGDMRGTDVIQAVRTEAACASFVLMSAFLTTDVTVEAMRLGAIDVVDKPISVDDLPDLIHNAVKYVATPATAPCGHPESISLTRLKRYSETAIPRSAAERWAINVIKGCLAEHDPKTLQRWADEAAVSYTNLRESCTLVGIDPHDARDLMRMLRTVVRTAADRCTLDVLLDTADGRTLARLLDRAGFQSAEDVQSVAIQEFFERQRFVARDSQAVPLVRDLVLRHTR
jgi:FixJ family two-component response regulator